MTDELTPDPTVATDETHDERPDTEGPLPAGTDADASADVPGESDGSLFDPADVADAPRRPHALKPVVEALVFASPEPITARSIVRLLEQPKDEVETALAELQEDYQRSAGLQLVQVAGGFQIVTRPELYEWVRRLFKERTTQKLSVQALETLAVIAYKQPVTSAEISEIRGVTAASGVLNTLLDRKLVKIVGRKQVVGRPFMYGTTREFLDKFGLKDLSDLPKVEDMSEALGFDLPTPVDEETTLPLDFGAAEAEVPGDEGAPTEAGETPPDAVEALEAPDDVDGDQGGDGDQGESNDER